MVAIRSVGLITVERTCNTSRTSQKLPQTICCSHSAEGDCDANHLTNRWSQPLAVPMTPFDFMKQFSMFTTLAAASGGSAPSR